MLGKYHCRESYFICAGKHLLSRTLTLTATADVSVTYEELQS